MKSVLETAVGGRSEAGQSAGSGLFTEAAAARVTEAFREAVFQAKAETDAVMKSAAAPSHASMKKARSIAWQIHELEGQLRAILRPTPALTVAESAH